MQAIETRFLGPTNHRDSRVKALCEAGSVTVDWNHGCNVDTNHLRAAHALAKKLKWAGTWVGGAAPGSRGYVFVNATWANTEFDQFTIDKDPNEERF